jgi:hypothetical protein
MPAFLARRGADNWRPLFSIAELIGGEWPAWCRDACERLRPQDDNDESALGDVLDALEAFCAERAANYEAAEQAQQHGFAVHAPDEFHRTGSEYDPAIPPEFVPAVDFCKWLGRSPMGATFAAATGGQNARALTPKAVAGLLSEADVVCDRFRRQNDKKRLQVRGFRLSDLERAWTERRPFVLSPREE